LGRFVRGDIVIIPFPFTDLSGNKKRPAFVVTDIYSRNENSICGYHQTGGESDQDNFSAMRYKERTGGILWELSLKL